MDVAALDTITDATTLRALVRQQGDALAQREATIVQRDQSLRAKELKIQKLTHELARLRRVQFGAKAEAMSAVQRDFFQADTLADMAEVGAALEAAQTPHRAPRKAVRKPLPPELPRRESIHAPEHTDCPCCGEALVKIGEHISEKLDVEPLNFFVRRDVYPQYACRHCETIVAEPVAPAIIDRGLAAPGLLAYVAISKYADHLPLYRLEGICARHGITLGRTTMAEWIGVMGLRLQPLVAALQAKLRQAPVLHADETPVAQLDPGRGKTKRAYLFAYRNTGPSPLIVFDYQPSRSGQHAVAFLADWKGALMVDGYAGYHQLFRAGVTELACWAHARRKFFDVWKANESPLAKQALDKIGAIYAIEAKLRDLADAERARHRQQHAGPLLADFKTWLDASVAHVLGGSALAKAIAYTRKRWSALARYVDNGAWPIDNNPAERAIRPIAIGRKNWLFAGSEMAGHRAAAIMSLIATAKANGLDPYAWLTDVLTRLPTTKDRDIDTLLPLA